MAKKSENGKREKKPKVAATAAPVKPVLTDDQLEAAFRHHLGKLKNLLGTEAAAKKATKDGYKAAKGDGISKKEIELALRLDTAEGVAQVQAEAERIARVSRWTGVGVQIDMFASEVETERKHFHAGKRAAMDDQMRKPPDHLAQSDHNEWFEGYDAGREARNLHLASQFKPLGDGAAAADSLTH